ncbi:MAG TPA: Fe-S cluster assembly protein SufD [Opitutaceae bacterium]|nr:Fe-S cluster assembly protein SufD [Opitutaceae bacterium]
MSALPDTLAAAPNGAFTADLFAAHLAALGHLPKWWLDRKRDAWNRFAALPLPLRTDELWRFSTVAGLKLDGYLLPDAADFKSQVSDLPAPFLGSFPHAAALTFANNRTLPGGAALPADLHARGVIFEPLETALAGHADLFRQHFMAQPVNLGSEKFAALNAALTTSGAFVFVPPGVELALPLVVNHVAASAGAALFPHTLVLLGDNARATVVENFLSTDPAAAGLVTGVNDLYAGPGAQLTYVGTQNWSRETLAFQLNSTVVQRDARVLSLNLHLGGRQSRHESHSRLQGPGSYSEMLALTVAQDSQEFDQRTLQSHQAPNTGSNLLYKNALLDQARTIFSGLIVVDPDAQKTDAYQSNRNLLLSDEAEANSLPGLEIQANDVRCTHGATSGHVDEEQMFYLKSRGIPPALARELLVFGFFEEVLNKLENEPLHAALRELIKARFTR